MARARLIKPGFFENEDLARLPFEARLLFAGLWTEADCKGRLEDRPVRLRAKLFPYEPQVDVDALLEQLAGAGFVTRYLVNGVRYIAVPTFLEHQKPHPREAASEIPDPPGGSPEDDPRYAEGSPKDNLRHAQGAPRRPVSISDPVSDPVPRSKPTRAARGASAAFETFWRDYPKKVAKQDAQKAFTALKVDGELLQLLLSRLDEQRQSDEWRREHGRYIPHPATWLRGRRWEDAGSEIVARPRVGTPAYYAQAGDWKEECQCLHGGRCGSGGDHATQLLVDAGRAERQAAS